jgi:uracil-DNA glycosylase
LNERLSLLHDEVVGCRACPRLVAWREQVGRQRRASFADDRYWARPLPGFGDPHARLVVVGLAPAAHGANRTGRMFTGDRSGDFLFAALYRNGFASQPESRHAADGLCLSDCWITAAVRCAPPQNRPAPAERDRCAIYLQRELELLPAVAIVALGGFAWDALLRVLGTPRPKPAFAHGLHLQIGDRHLLGTYHPSQQNTFTGRLTPGMLDAVFAHAAMLLGRQSGRRVLGWSP